MCRNEIVLPVVTNNRRASVATRAVPRVVRVRVKVEDAAEVVHRRKVSARLHKCQEAIRAASRAVAQAAQLTRWVLWTMSRESGIGSCEGV
jgi:hypothetical protein